MRLWLFLAGLVLFSYWLTDRYRLYALRKNIMDLPNERSSHSLPTPRGGGLSLILSFYLGLVAVFIKEVVDYPIFISMLVGGTLIAVVGWIDDQGHVSAKKRMLIQLLAAIFAMAMIGGVPKLPVFDYTITLEYVGYILCVLAIVWSTNLFNFMDGIDGIAAIEAVTVSLGAAFILYYIGGNFYAAVSLIVLVAACIGFLLLNFPPAKIFMGDVGSGFLGFALGVYAIGTSVEGGISPWSWMILYGIFLGDATLTLIRRVIRKEKWYQPHRTHGYQILSRRWNSHKKVSLAVLVFNLCYLFPLAYLASQWPFWSLPLLILAYVPIIAILLYLGAGDSETDQANTPAINTLVNPKREISE